MHDFDAMSWVLGESAVQVYAQETDGISNLAVITFASGARGTASGARRNAQGYDARME